MLFSTSSPVSFLIAASALLLPSVVYGHGYLAYPTARAPSGNPFTGKALCRGESPKAPTSVPSKLDLKFHITAGHPGPCEVYVLDEHLKNPVKVGERSDCAKTKAPKPWRVDLSRFEGRRMVLRWVWHATNKGKKENYENCSDIVVKKNGGNGSAKRPPPVREEGGAEDEGPKSAEKHEGNRRRNAPQQQKPRAQRQAKEEEESVKGNERSVSSPKRSERPAAKKVENKQEAENDEQLGAAKGEKTTEKNEEEETAQDFGVAE